MFTTPSTTNVHAPAASVPPAAAAPAPVLPPYTEEEERWIRLRDSLDPVQHLPLDINSAFYPTYNSVHLLPAVDEAFNAGLMTGTGVPTTFNYVNLLRSSAGMHCQRLYYQSGLANGIRQRLGAAASAPTAQIAPTTQRDHAPKLNPPKLFDATRSEYKSFIMQLNLIFNSDPDQYTGTNADNAKIAYAASFLAGSAKEWFQPHINETTGAISFPTWTEFVAALRAAFDDPDAYQTAYTKISTLRQERDCSSYHAAFVPLARNLGIDERTRILFFKKGLNGELKKALSTQITLCDIFDEFVQACIKIDNQIRANKEAQDAIPRMQGGQFAPAPAASTSTGTHSDPMDLSGARYRSQKRGLVTDQEKKHRRDNNLCLYCGSSWHWTSQYPHKRLRGKPSAAAAATSEGGVLIPPVPVLSSASVTPAQVLYEAQN